MSGGVDSSVAALLLQKQGWQIIGATMDTGWGNAPEQAAALCRELGIEHHVVDVREHFDKQIVQPFVDSYLSGLTPNPCVDCNCRVKFPVFFPLMEKLNVDYLATGHYIRLIQQNGRYLLSKGMDPAKDQSYFLYRLTQDILSRAVFPLGELTKQQVRSIALEEGLSAAGQKDSYDICFVQDGDYRTLLRQRAADRLKPGNVVDTEGKVVGRHQGLANYTLGQRRGLELALGKPVYVLKLDQQHNQIVVGGKDELNCRQAYTRDNNLLPWDELTGPQQVEVKIRFKAESAPAVISPVPGGEGLVRIDFEQPQWNITPGQSAVFYQGDILIGGGRLL